MTDKLTKPQLALLRRLHTVGAMYGVGKVQNNLVAKGFACWNDCGSATAITPAGRVRAELEFGPRG